MREKLKDEDLLPGARYRATHQASVDAILNPMGIKRKVISIGDNFLNHDNWAVRALAQEFCIFVDTSKPAKLSDLDITDLINKANRSKVSDPHIIIAEIPDRIPVNVATAFIGAAYHEAWHTKYSCRYPQSKISHSFASSVFKPRFDKAPWGKLAETLLLWMNVIEDIRIERLGCKDFIGAYTRMESIQDFVIEKEKEVFSDRDKDHIMAIVVSAFRDIGKNYNTFHVREALKRYEKINPVAYKLVVCGPLRPILDRVMNLTKDDDKECLPLAMDIIIAISELANSEEMAQEAAKDMNSSSKKLKDGENTGNSNATGDDLTSNGTNKGEEITADQVQKAAKKFMKDAGSNDGTKIILDITDAIKDALRGAEKKTRNGREIFRPLTTAYDQIVHVIPRTSNCSFVADNHRAVRKQTNYLRTRLRHLFKATELVDVEHGLKRGKGISERMLAESVGLVRNNYAPDRPFFDSSEAPDLSMSAVIVVDESGSMQNKLNETCKILLCLTEALDSIGCKTAVAGFMQGRGAGGHLVEEIRADPISSVGQFHRSHPMVYHIFKLFHEKFHYIKERFGSLAANDGTPMGDGINIALNMLSERKEGHRFIFVITDGQPDDSGPVRNRIKAATSIGIKVIGVGLGTETEYVKDCFPDSVWSRDIDEIPPLLVKKVTGIVERNEKFRGRKLSKDLEVL